MFRLTRSSRRWLVVLVLLAVFLPPGSFAAAQSGGGSELPPPSDPPEAAGLPAIPGLSPVFPINWADSYKESVQVAYNTQHHEYLVVWESQY